MVDFEEFKRDGDKLKTIYYATYGEKTFQLGHIEFFKDWDLWVWKQNTDVVLSDECIGDIYHKLLTLNKICRQTRDF